MLKIPNREIASIFEDTVVAYFKNTADTSLLNSLINALWESDEAVIQIVTEKYAEGLYGYTQILCYGIAFYQKQAKVKKLIN